MANVLQCISLGLGCSEPIIEASFLEVGFFYVQGFSMRYGCREHSSEQRAGLFHPVSMMSHILMAGVSKAGQHSPQRISDIKPWSENGG